MESGTRLGPYEILEQLGAGGMGEVYLAQDTRLGRKVAIKVLPEQFANDPERLARFEQEARAAAGLNHPHIAVVHDIGEQDGTYYMVQERLEGQTLRATIDASLALPRALALGIEIAEALNAAHKVRIVHRDIKPENVFVTEDGHAKVLDFGLAKLTEVGGSGGSDASMSPTLLGTQAGEVMGTAGYMAPEQAQGEEIDHRADVFAFGCVLYEMTTGERPFAGANVYETLGKIVSGEPEPLESRLPGAPAELRRIVGKCLSKDRAMRYQTAGDLVVDLRLLLRGLDSGQTESVEARFAEGRAGSRGVPLGLVAALLLTTAVGTFLASRALQPAVAEPPMRTFRIDFPADFPDLQRCCTTNLVTSRNDEFLALFSNAGGGFADSGLSVRHQDAPGFLRLGDFRGYNPDVSPDGEWIVYNEMMNDSGRVEVRLRKVALAGGAPFDLGVVGLAPPAWGDDGYIYVAGAPAVRRVPEDGGEIEVIEPAGPTDFAAVNQVFAIPGGRLLLLGIGDNTTLGSGLVAAMDLESREVVVLVDDGVDPRWSPTGHLLWTRAGAVYAAAFDAKEVALVGRPALVLQGVAAGFNGVPNYSLSDAGTLAWVPGSGTNVVDRFRGRLVWIDREGEVTPASAREELLAGLRVAFGGSHVAAAVLDGDGGSDVWVLDVAQDGMVRLTADGASRGPFWSRDDTWVYFTAGESESGNIWRRRADFSAPAELVLDRALRQVGGDVSPDGRLLVFEERVPQEDTNNPRGDLWLLPLDGGDPFPFVESPDDESDPRFSADGNLIAYISNESGTAQVHVREIDGGRRALVSPGEGRSDSPAWSHDGQYLYYLSMGSIFEVRVEVSSEGLRVSPPTQLHAADRTLGMGLDVRADGVFLASQLMNLRTDESAPAAPAQIMMTLNWFQELRRLAPRDQ